MCSDSTAVGSAEPSEPAHVSRGADFYRALNAEWICDQIKTPQGDIDGGFRDAWRTVEANLLSVVDGELAGTHIAEFFRAMNRAPDPVLRPLTTLRTELNIIERLKAITDSPGVLAEMHCLGVVGPLELTVRWSDTAGRNEMIVKPRRMPRVHGHYRDSSILAATAVSVEDVDIVAAVLDAPWAHIDRSAVKSLQSTLGKLKESSPQFDWSSWVLAHGVEDDDAILIEDEDLVVESVWAWQRCAPKELRAWLTWRLLTTRSDQLGEGKLERRCQAMRLTERFFGSALADAYAAAYGSPIARQEAADLAEQIRHALVEVLHHLPVPRRVADGLAGRVADVAIEIAPFGDGEQMTQDVDLVGEPFDILRAAHRDEIAQVLGLHREKRRIDWEPTRVYSATGMFNHAKAVLRIPFGLLDVPFFDVRKSPICNLATLGTIIGHELAHAIDLSVWDKLWNSDSDRIASTQLGGGALFGGLIDQAKIRVFDPNNTLDYDIDPRLVLNEVFCDHLGVWSAVHVLRSREAESCELVEFFEQWVVMMREHASTDERALRLAEDPHPPAEVRCNWVLRNTDAFHDATATSTHDPMWLPYEARLCRLGDQGGV
ncbi:hypothetical protein A5766_13935 [Gordonia sp. 852002-51296_SCH5728562-b]|nr:hypothetical protein A5766_13935 [Gordonia sp. 852002-51296_SCH5728562-b]